MEISELKEKIESKDVDDIQNLILVSSDETSEIISYQYIRKIAEIKGLNLKLIDTIDDIPDQSFVIDDNLYLLVVDSFSDCSGWPPNLFVMCKSAKLGNTVKIPKLDDWQVVDFVLSLAPGLQYDELEKLIKRYSRDYRKFITDMQKVSAFDKDDQQVIFDELMASGAFDSVSNLTAFDFTNAVIKKDFKSLTEIYKVINFIDVTPMHVMTILINNFKNIVKIQMIPTITAADLGISDKQFFVIKKYNCGYYTNEQLIKILTMLSRLEFKFKYEELPVDDIIDYIVINILGV